MNEATAIVPIQENSDFTLYNLPFGVFRKKGEASREARVAVAVGRNVLDLCALAETDLFEACSPDTPLRGAAADVFGQESLNRFIKLGEQCCSETRRLVQRALSRDSGLCPQLERALENSRADAFLTAQDVVDVLLPVEIGDYTDFYASKEHASHLGQMMRGPGHELTPNYVHLPIGYHGRASSVVVSGTPITRPCGQIKPEGSDCPVFKPTERLDFELELGAIIGRDSILGERIPVEHSRQYIFGYVLVNDWSARDIQRWEYQPLGPFNSKNFATTISPWVVTREALEPYRVAAPHQDPPVLQYLNEDAGRTNLDLNLSVMLNGITISQCNFRGMYWTFEQMVAHHTSTGCNLRCGDLLASGTVSGAEPNTYGSMIELTWGGRHPLKLPNGKQRTFLEDGDEVELHGYAGAGSRRVGFGRCHGCILPAVV
ncbi:fumarylacetoacetase [Cyanidioschyzon merolae strain 10D]|jgi:fumarylacetoacetase|uniref:Fumarylacetoacetase n=1 Tax=Cyanidioschyzon merolae (strain NIES-3377 / 10D) TaxID=280699 RepID=M1VKL1_CYAM1|nr:fumarylacetoacetase [Cyanidioschyzon merolae strain 10D]BAM82058.1 fumarylacetoacetase [Cyanidioschyzon merolae strain 10D]|eukprot:XP_005538094.1 fumarylacetoacetase [Cyanidioschyzon merolae strain 10D]